MLCILRPPLHLLTLNINSKQAAIQPQERIITRRGLLILSLPPVRTSKSIFFCCRCYLRSVWSVQEKVSGFRPELYLHSWQIWVMYITTFLTPQPPRICIIYPLIAKKNKKNPYVAPHSMWRFLLRVLISIFCIFLINMHYVFLPLSFSASHVPTRKRMLLSVSNPISNFHTAVGH